MEIENTTVYTKELVMRFQRFNARLVKSAPWSTHFLFALLFAMLTVGLVYSIIIRGWLFTALIALGMVIFGRRYYFLYIAPARKFDSSSFRDSEQRYVFRKQGFSAASGDDEMKKKYDEVRICYETPEAFYIYFNKAQAFIVSKNGFTSGSAAELSRRLGDALGAKRFSTIKN